MPRQMKGTAADRAAVLEAMRRLLWKPWRKYTVSK